MARTVNLTRLALWRSRVRRQLASGLSIAQFCAREQCAVSAFYRWKRHFEFMQPKDQLPATTTPSTSAFLPVTLRAVASDPIETAAIEADLPNGIRLRIPTADFLLACRLVRAVAGARTQSGGSR